MSSIAASPSRRSFSLLGVEVHLRLTSVETENRFAVIEMSLPAGFSGAPPHTHRVLTEQFTVLEGSLDVMIETTWATLLPGDTRVARPGTVHGFRNGSAEHVRFLLIVTPGGHERFFCELMDWMEQEPVWPPHDRQALVEFGRRHDTEYC